MKSLAPIVGYAGGKRRALPRLRRFFDPSQIRVYVEPFVGMGANYLDLRARGYRGPAILADNNPSVADLWTILHGPQADLLCVEAAALETMPVTADHFMALKREPEADPIRRAALFLWLTNYSFGNQPPRYHGAGWHGRGSKLTSAERWGKTFPWSDCVKRLHAVVKALQGMPCVVHPDGVEVMKALIGVEDMYADPPYEDTERYGAGQLPTYVPQIMAAKVRLAVFSEKRQLDLPPPWECDQGALTARQSPRKGATGERSEYIYARRS